jgi:hypothetical protein
MLAASSGNAAASAQSQAAYALPEAEHDRKPWRRRPQRIPRRDRSREAIAEVDRLLEAAEALGQQTGRERVGRERSDPTEHPAEQVRDSDSPDEHERRADQADVREAPLPRGPCS